MDISGEIDKCIIPISPMRGASAHQFSASSVRSALLTMVNMKVTVSQEDRYQQFRGTWCFFLQGIKFFCTEDGGSRFLRDLDVFTYFPNYTASHGGRR
jgi:hypothetical protein